MFIRKHNTLSAIFSGLVILLSIYMVATKNREGKSLQPKEYKFIDDSCCIPPSVYDVQNELSIYQDGSSWTDENGKGKVLANFRGKVVILSMFYSHCTISCPLLINDMKKVEQRISIQDPGKVAFVHVTMDPSRDTPSVLRALSERQNLDLNKWTLLTGKEDAIQSLGALLGVSFVKKGDGDFDHSNQITILNRKGEISYKHFGVGGSVDDIVAVVDSIGMRG
ncbi:MAG: SCO family protein [Candidatus Kryptoniota bacterium]